MQSLTPIRFTTKGEMEAEDDGDAWKRSETWTEESLSGR
jgi:hypothetical protein